MQVYNRTIDLIPQDYPLCLAADPEEVLCIDIETTGLSPEHNQICLIGCAYLQNGRWQLIQWYDETGASEADILLSFLIFARKYHTLLHYNGARFDLPFLRRRIEKCEPARRLDGQAILDQMQSLDLYQGIRPWKKLLGLDSLQQKSVEAFLEDGRTEDLDGRDLVKIYQIATAAARLMPEQTSAPEGSDSDRDSEQTTAEQSAPKGAKELLEMQQLILEHNAADVRGLVAITPLLALSDLFRHPINIYKAQADHYRSYDNSSREEIILFGRIQDVPEQIIPRKLVFTADGCYASLDGNQLTLKVPLFRGELKFFYANYQDYYYLPMEDMAIHKSLASFVDRSHRVQATAATCYTRKTGAFLPEWDRFHEPFFKKEYKEPNAWFEFTPEMKKDKQFFCDYATHVMQHILVVSGAQKEQYGDN